MSDETPSSREGPAYPPKGAIGTKCSPTTVALDSPLSPPTHSRWSDDPVAEAHAQMLVARLAACGNAQISQPDDLELVRELGRGSFGVAALCRSREDGGAVVLKKIPLAKLDAKGVVRLVSEVRPSID